METKRSYRYFNILMLVGLVLGLGFYFSYLKSPTKITPPQARAAGSACNMVLGTDPVAFCDTFDAPAGIGNRSGQLNGTIWGVSRTNWLTDLGGHSNAWAATQIQECDGTTPTVRAPNDVIICNGQLREATNDNPSGIFENGGVLVLAMYPKQPFDFANRTGTVSFDVGDDSQGSHAAWPEFWMSNLPVPAPFAHFLTWVSLPQFGFGIRFDGFVDNNGNGNSCPEGSGYIGVGSAIVVNNYIADDFDNPGHTVMLRGFDCVKQPTIPGQLNHFEIQISQNQIDVYGTDAGVTPTLANLKHLETISNFNLGFTRGLVWLEDVHYNADKANPNNPAASQRQHTFIWDNLAFDGPFTYHDLSYDALDNNVPYNNCSLADITCPVNLGKFSDVNQSATWSVPNMPANPTATAVRVLFNFYHYNPPTILNITVNGNPHSQAWPYGSSDTLGNTTAGFTWRTDAITIPITDLVPGTNVVTIGSDQALVTSNVNIVLVDAGVTPPPPPPPPPDTIPPTVSLTAPTSGATISGTTAITANASDNVAVAGVQFKLDGSNLGSLDTTSPYAINWDSTTATNGSHTLTAVATDTSNNSTTSTTVSVTVNNGVATPGTCQFLSSSTTAAFCEDLSGGVKSGGRAGDLDDSKWSVGRFVGGSSATNLIAFPPTPVEPCKSGVSSVSSDNDILVCDSSSGHAGQMETAMSAQNYAMLALRPRQAFDFAGRTGTITFNVDAITEGEGSWWPGVYVTDEPTSGAINSSSVIGMMPNNGIGMNFDDNCAVTDASLTKIDNVFLYNNTVETSVPLNNTVCISTKRGFLNHIEIRLSQTSVQIWASDYSTDGVNFPNFRQIGSAAINLPFTRGYVHFEQKERAPIKNEPGFYNLGYTNNYWSNLGFDGPVVTPEVGYAVPDSLTVDPNSANDSDAHIAGAMNIGYGILTNPTSMFSCCTSGGSRTTIGSFSFPSVNLSGVTSAKLTFSVTYTYIAPSFTTSNVALHYSLNGGAMQNPNPQPNYAAEFLCPGCPGSPNGGEGVPYSFPVSLSNLVTGTNTISFAVDNSNNSYPPVVANIDLLTFGGSVTSNQLPVGNFDGLKSDGVTLQGWSYDPDSTSTSNNVQIFVNGPVGTGTLIFSGPTSILRTDVNTTFSITGNHGFEFAIPSQYQDGVSHSYYVYGIDVNDGTKSTLLTGSPLSFTVGGSSTYQRTISIASLDGRSTKVISGSLDVLNSSKGLIKTYAFTTNSSGTATITFDIPTQTVFLKVRALPFLTRLLSNVNLANNTTYAFPILLTGDINQDDIVNSIDFSILNSHWFTTDATSDLNQDGLVNSLDFSLLNKNWFVSGEQ